MCIAILNPTEVTLEKSVLKTCWENNRDGAGMLYVVNGVLTTHKEMKNFDSFYNHYLDVRKKHRDSQVVIHFRISTHGKVDLTNCHPFIVNDEWGFVHNGIISSAPKSKEFSDTYMFNQEVLQKLPKDWLFNDGIFDLVQEYIGSSKLLFLNSSNDAYIVNEEWGVWDMGCWFSNTTYKASKYLDYGGVQVAKGSTPTATPRWGEGKWGTAYGRNWLDEDDADLDSWNSSFDKDWEKKWEKDYKYNDKTGKWETIDVVDSEYAENPWGIDDPMAEYTDSCESCLEEKNCRYDYIYDCSICKTCASDLHNIN